MVRLTPELVKLIPETLNKYDDELEIKTGAKMIDIAKHATAAGPEIEKKLMRAKAAVVPITAGLGIIKGFSRAVAAISNHVGLRTFVTDGTDVAGFAEAITNGANIVFAADDNMFAAFNLNTKRVVENSKATGRAYAAALELAAGGVGGKPVSVIGVGRVGSAAVDHLIKKDATVYVVDINEAKVARVMRVYRERVWLCQLVEEALEQANLVLLAAPARDIITEEMVNENMIISAPSIPLGLTEKALLKLPETKLIHDPLQLGVATMAIKALNT